jgi:hypothetical protein
MVGRPISGLRSRRCRGRFCAALEESDSTCSKAIIGYQREGTVMHMQLWFKRSRYEDHSYFAEKSYDGHMRICCVSANPDGVRRSTFGAGIGPNQFEELARLMVEVDPRAAIRAFGAGMRDVEVEKREVDSSETVAA